MSSTATETPTDRPGYTVPALAPVVGLPLDRLRCLIRRHEDLKQLLVKFGPTRLLPPEHLETFRERLAACSPPLNRKRSPPRAKRTPSRNEVEAAIRVLDAYFELVGLVGQMRLMREGADGSPD